jgi:hypothetical protein
MAVRTATAQALDTAIDSMLTALDNYLALDGQTGEPPNSTAEYFWEVLVSKLVQRNRMSPIIFNNRRSLRSYSVADLPTNSVEAKDPNA